MGRETPPPPYPYPAQVTRPMGPFDYETSWRSKFPKIPVLILAIVQVIFDVIIFILEIASIAVLVYSVTAVGIWSGAAFLSAAILLFILGEYFFIHLFIHK